VRGVPRRSPTAGTAMRRGGSKKSQCADPTAKYFHGKDEMSESARADSIEAWMIRLRVRELRELRGWTQQELASRVGVRRQTIIAIEQGGTTRVTLEVLERLGQALGVDSALLIETKPGRAGE
jgi:DNA-binding XRE family transcriptional regulator